jgi:hypothetical protein
MFIIILVFNSIFLSACNIIDTIEYFFKRTAPDAVSDEYPYELPKKTENEIRKAVEEAKEEIAKEEENRKQEEQEKQDQQILESGDLPLDALLEDTGKSFPDEPVTYTGNVENIGIKLIIDFKNKTVSGSVAMDDGIWYIDAPIVSGALIVDSETLNVTSRFDGTIGNREVGKSEPFTGSINGIISSDFGTFKGTLLETTEGVSMDFNASGK